MIEDRREWWFIYIITVFTALTVFFTFMTYVSFYFILLAFIFMFVVFVTDWVTFDMSFYSWFNQIIREAEGNTKKGKKNRWEWTMEIEGYRKDGTTIKRTKRSIWIAGTVGTMICILCLALMIYLIPPALF
ncbi:MAG: hypothetical protein FWG96_03885 [Methanomassiliicoccaceae archaeon]|nr:hypothetical protein [Methanomassiliicoccaceae archaeon]